MEASHSHVDPKAKSLVQAYMLATHQLEEPRVFADPLAARIVNISVDLLAGPWRDDGGYASDMRMQTALEHRFADDVAVETQADGTTQIAVLDAGLDTLLYRRKYPNTRLFEVDDPATQSWKRQLLAVTGITGRTAINYINLAPGHDLHSSTLADSGYDFHRPTLVVWLDSAMFLPTSRVVETISWFDRHRARLDLIWNYLEPDDSPPDTPNPLQDVMARANLTLVSYFTPEEARHLMRDHHFDTIVDLDWADMLTRYLPAQSNRPDFIHGHTIRATRLAAPPR